jgi:hypothetical protein
MTILLMKVERAKQRQLQKQIPCGDDNQKGKDNCKL